VIRFDGAKNVRDLGGLPTSNGGRTRPGVIYRSDGLSRLNATDLDRLASLRLGTVIDIRSDSERARAPDRVPAAAPPRFYYRGFLAAGTAELFVAINRDRAGPDEAHAFMCANYARMPFAHVEELRDLMHFLIAPATAPHLIHCTSGKDRTGVVCALVLLAVGVPLDAVLADYDLSNGDWQAVDVFGPNARADTIAAVMAAHADYLLASLHEINARCGSLERYCDEWLAFGTRERAALTRLLVDPR
jgi:protein-tyrosine phosphatase